MAKQIRYYQDELNDDFAGTNICTKQIPPDFKYIHRNPIWMFIEFVFYRFIAQPLTALFNKIVYGTTVRNRKILKKVKGGYFIYANHTQVPGDAFTPHMATFPKKPFIVVNPDATSIPFIQNIVVMLGAIPLPSCLTNSRTYKACIMRRIQMKKVVTIYPEAHIWPYYTGIRPFSDASFAFPCEFDTPVFAMTSTYVKRKFFKRPKCIVYLDGPFYPDMSLSLPDRKEKLRNEVYQAMVERSKLSNYDYIKYVKVETETDDIVEKNIGQANEIA